MERRILLKVQQVRLLSKGPEETFLIGQRLGQILREGDVVGLFGELGSGKTTFVKGVASAFSITERDIASASFVIISEHRGKIKKDGEDYTISFHHIDLYRLVDTEIDFIGLDEYIGRGITIIEWAERLGEMPIDMIKVRFEIVDSEEREIIIEGISEEDWNNR